VLGVLIIPGILWIEVRTSTVKDMRVDNPVRVQFDRVNERLEGANAINVVVEATGPGEILEPHHLRALEELAEWIEAQPEVGGTTSLVDYVKAINRGFHEDSEAHHAIPETAQLVSQLLLIGANDELPQFVDSDREFANILVRTQAVDTDEVSGLADRIEERLLGLGKGLSATVTGNAVLLSRTMDEIATGQAISLSLALVIIYAVLVVLFTSFRIGLIALIPNALSVVFFFGILGWFDFPLNTSTSLVACVVLGIAVDDTIHLMVQFNDASKRHGDENRGVVEALSSVGPPVSYTTGALVIGFMFMIPSELGTIADFGILCAVTLALAWLIDLTFTPALAMGMKIVTIWDLLTLDLGEKPHRSIPLFEGFREHQARLVALLTSFQTVRAGTKLISAGDPGGEMFIVVDGELSASIERENQRIHLRKLSRGDVIGEVGIFFGERTADVRTDTDVRMIRLTQDSLKRFARRHPRIATRLYANLSRVLAERLANVTTRVH
jgi:preprotein translocase subunit SecF